MASETSPARRRLWTVVFTLTYILLVLPVWYNAVRVPRVPLPTEDIARLEAELADPLAGALPVTLTAYLICPGPPHACLEYRELSGLAAQLGAEVLREAGLAGQQAPLQVRVLQDAPGSCTASSWAAPGFAMLRQRAQQLSTQRQGQQAAAAGGSAGSGGGGGGGGGGAGLSGCSDVAASPERLRGVMGLEARELEDWASRDLAGQDRPGHYHVFVLPDPWLSANGLPYGMVGRRRIAAVRYPPGRRASHGSVVRLAAMLAAPAFASYLGGVDRSGADTDPDASQPLPLSPAAQLHLSFSLCNAHPSPHPGAGAGAGRSSAASSAAAAALVWSFPSFEAQYVGPLKAALSPAARITVSSQVLYFTPARVNASWDERRRTFVLPYSQLPFFVDSSWPLDPGRTGLPTSAAGGGAVPYDVAAVVAGSRAVAIGEVLTLPPPQVGSAAAGRAAADAAAAALPHLLPPPAAESLPPAVLNMVLFAPPPTQRPMVLLGPDGEAAPANSFRVPGWGMLQVLNQVPSPGQITTQVEQESMEAFAIEVVSQLRSLLGLAPARRRLLQLANPKLTANRSATTSASTSTSATAVNTITGGAVTFHTADADAAADGGDGAVGSVTLLTPLRTGFAPWEVDSLLRRRVWGDVRAAGATHGSLARLLAAVPTLALPPAVGRLVRRSVGALEAALARAAEGRYEEASRAAQEARGWAEAAISDPSLSARLNVPDSHHVGVYLPFCLPAAVPLIQALLAELRRLRRKRKAAQGGATADGGCKVQEQGSSAAAKGTVAPEEDADLLKRGSCGSVG